MCLCVCGGEGGIFDVGVNGMFIVSFLLQEGGGGRQGAGGGFDAGVNGAEFVLLLLFFRGGGVGVGGAFNAGVNGLLRWRGGGVIFDVDLKNVCSFLCSG